MWSSKSVHTYTVLCSKVKSALHSFWISSFYLIKMYRLKNMETFFCKSVLSWHKFINNRCVKLKSSALRKTRLAQKKKITQLFFLDFPHMFCYNIYPLFCTPINYVTCFRRKQLTLYYYVETKGWHSIRSLQILRLNLYQ